MHAIVITKPGNPEVLDWQQVPDPTPGPDDVLIETAAAGVNRADISQRQGFYPPPPGASVYPGLECSGRIIATGANVTDWAEGDEVCALLAGGGYAELVAVNHGHVLPKPDNVTLAHAAALPEAACTVYSNVFQIACLRKDELLLVHGGSSGIGTMAIQLAKAIGARVAVTAGSAEKLSKCSALGADIGIDYKTEDFVPIIKEAGGADVILDIMGASYLGRNVDALTVNGRLVIIGLQGGGRAELDIAAMHRKRAALFATTLRARPTEEKTAIVQAVRDNVWPLIAAGQVRPVIDTELPMEQAAQAHMKMAASTHTGKILLLTPNRLGA